MKELTLENTLETYISEKKKWEKERDAIPDGIFKEDAEWLKKYGTKYGTEEEDAKTEIY